MKQQIKEVELRKWIFEETILIVCMLSHSSKGKAGNAFC